MTHDAFDSREFYELMQAYRWSGITDPAETVGAFEAVKEFARAAVRAERDACWGAINDEIRPGSIGGNGSDQTAMRNGLIIASNLIAARDRA